MARFARIVIPNYPHHIIQRGNRRQDIFFCDEDKKSYLELLNEYGKKAEDYLWSSAKAHVFKRKDVLLSDNFMLVEITDWGAYLREETTQSDQNLLRLHAYTGRPLGNKKFIAELEAPTGRILKKKKPGPKKKN